MLEHLRVRLRDALDFAPLAGLLKKKPDGQLIHAPFSLFPCPISPTTERALSGLTPFFNRLAWSVSRDGSFLRSILEESARSDPFIARLVSLLPARAPAQTLYLQLTRSDYFLQAPPGEEISIRQVELNTIAASYAGLAAKVNLVHRQLLRGTPWADSLIPNDPIPATAEGIAAACRLYGHPGASVVMVVQPGEQNVFDQRLLEYALLERDLPVTRATLEEIGERGRLKEGHLVLDNQTVAVAYFRAGYDPADYEQEAAWKGRELVEHSSAIAIPTVATQLAGSKKVQQVLTEPILLRNFTDEAEAVELAATFAGMYALDDALEQPGETIHAWQAAVAEPARFVLKPQREGGGHNLYDEDLARKLSTMEPGERPAFVLMERIRPVVHPAAMVSDGVMNEEEGVSEIGRFGLLLADGNELLKNEELGYLVRTKGSQVREGGVSAGYGFLNSLFAQPAA